MILTRNSVLTLCLICAFFPYTSLFFYSHSDVQPVTTVIAGILFISIALTSTTTIVHKSVLSLLVIAFWAIIYFPSIPWEEMYHSSYLRSNFAYFTAPIVFSLFALYKIKNIHKILIGCIAVAVLTPYLELLFKLLGYHDEINGFFSMFAKRNRVHGMGRGISGIYPEQSFVALMLTLYLMLYSYICLIYQKKISKVLILLCVGAIALSLSGTILLILLTGGVALALTTFRLKKYKYMLGVFVIVVGMLWGGIYATPYLPQNSRVVETLETLRTSPHLVFFSDQSTFARFFALYFTAFSISYSEYIGAGTGGYQPISTGLINLLRQQNDIVLELAHSRNADMYIGGQQLMSGFGNYIVDFGVIGIMALLIFIISIYTGINKCKYLVPPNDNLRLLMYKSFIFFFLTVNWFQAISVAHPLPWLLLGIVMNKEYDKDYVFNVTSKYMRRYKPPN